MGNITWALLANTDEYKSWAKFKNSNTELVGIYVSNFARKIADVEKLSKSCTNPVESDLGFDSGDNIT